jgi:hypothetical protein
LVSITFSFSAQRLPVKRALLPGPQFPEYSPGSSFGEDLIIFVGKVKVIRPLHGKPPARSNHGDCLPVSSPSVKFMPDWN